jgi:(1->4)-alpha-D-glucan 1-alpha-D-glucosylmutase
MHNSLVQTVLKLTVPGMPDIYQGAEFWDLSLVDPDNRIPVDFGARRKVLDTDDKGLIEPQELRGLMDHWCDGSIKLRLIQRLLKLRIDLPQLFDEASYLALGINGPAADRICSFARQSGPSILVVAVALFPSKMPLEGDAWNDDKIALPASFDAKLLYNLLDGSEIQIRDHSIQASEIFKTLPVAVLTAANA